MRKLLLFLLTLVPAVAQINVQKSNDGTNTITNGNIVIGSGTVLSASGSGQIIATNGGGGGGSPGGANGQVQFNNAGVFGGFTVGGDATLNANTGTLTLANVNSGPQTLAGITFNAKGLITSGTPLSSLASYGILDGYNTVSNDINVTGSGSTHTLVLGWTGQLSIARGGTGQSTANAALNALLPSQSGVTSGYVLSTNGANTSWISNGAGGSSAWNSLTGIPSPTFSHTGDVTGSVTLSASGPASGALTLATVNSNVGTFGNASNTVTVTVNGKGLVTAIQANTPSIPTTDLTGTLQAAQFPALTGDVTTLSGSVATTVGKINGTSLAGLTSGLLYNTTSTGVPSIATATQVFNLLGSNGGSYQVLYTPSANTLAGLANGTTGQVLTATTSGAPQWTTLSSGGNVNTTTLTQNGAVYASGATNILSTAAMTNGQLLIGSTGVAPALGTLSGGTNISFTNGAGSITANLTGQVGLANGGTNANLTASNGGIVYSGASAFAVLAGASTANEMLLSGAGSPPVWSTVTHPATTTVNQLLYSSSNNVLTGLPTANNAVLVTSSGGTPSIAAPGGSLQVATSVLQLVGDASSPGNGYYYGTNGSGTKGFYAIPGGAASANPTSTIGLTAVNGSASTFMTSDSAPPLSQAIQPTWTKVHTWSFTDTSSSANAHYVLDLTPTLNQTSTAGFTELFDNRTETAAGSGHQYFIDFQVGGTDKWVVDHTGTVLDGIWNGTAIGTAYIAPGTNGQFLTTSSSVATWGNTVSNFAFTGGLVGNWTTVTTSQSLTTGSSGNYGVVVNATANTTMTLPTAPATGTTYAIYNENTGTVTVSGAQNVNGHSGGVTLQEFAGSSFIYNGTQWVTNAPTALPNGTTATTQAFADDTTDVATDAFVINNIVGTVKTITQAGSSFTVGQLVYNNNNTWTVSDQATAPHVDGIVVAASGTTFTVQFNGYENAITGLTADTQYYLGSAGAITSTAPTSTTTYLVPVLWAGTSGVGTIQIGSPISLALIPTSVIQGTVTNDNAAVGNIGEVVQSVIASSSAVTLTTSTDSYNLTSLSLTAGDWDVWLTIKFLPASTASITNLAEGISQTTATIPAVTLGDNSSGQQPFATAGVVLGANAITETIGPFRESLTSTTTVYGVGNGTFTIAGMTMYGNMYARRAR